MYEEILQQLGLTEGEAKVYEALLFLGPITVGPIVKKAGVSSSNVYDILHRLLDKGLISFTMREKTKYFQAVTPNRIKDYLEKQEAEVQKSKQIFTKLLPQLEQLRPLSRRSEETEIFIGEKGLLTAYERLLENSHKTDPGYFFYVHNTTYYERAETFYRKSWNLVKRFGNHWRGISHEALRTTKLVKYYPHFIEQRYVPYPVPGNIDIINHKVLITVWRDKPIGILIHSPEVADNFIHYFETVWNQANS